MPPFPSEAWCHEAIRLLNEDPDGPAAAQDWTGDFGVVIDGPNGPLAVRVGEPIAGRLPAPRAVSVEDLEANAPTYFARASEADWRALIEEHLDPIAAIVQKRLIARGDLSQLVARLRFRGLAERWLCQLRAGLTP
jgi:hypothetical protein